MVREPIRPLVCAVLCGLLMTACGGTGTDVALSEEEPGTQRSELCSGLTVTSLVVSGASTYEGEMAASGTWTVAPGANAVRLEYSVDGVLSGTEERVGATGTWYFSTTGIRCGPRNLVVKAWPMVIDSAGNRSTCSTALTSTSSTVTEDCTWTLNGSMACGSAPYPVCPSYYSRCPASPGGKVCPAYGYPCLSQRTPAISDLYYCL